MEHGRIHRHIVRGIDEVGWGRVEEQEHGSCGAGLINPTDFTDSYGKLPGSMQHTVNVIASCRADNPKLIGLDPACGNTQPGPFRQTRLSQGSGLLWEQS